MADRPKKRKPSFDVARAPLENERAGWVYRSEPPGTPAAPAAPVRPVSSPAPAGRRLESAADLALAPFTLSLMVLFAKLRWLIGPRGPR